MSLQHENNEKSPLFKEVSVVKIPTAAPVVASRDWVADEQPLEVRIDGKPITILMRTPGSDHELVIGFLFSEGIIVAANAIDEINFSSAENVNPSAPQLGTIAEVKLSESGKKQAILIDRLFLSSSSCGVCGKRTIESLALSPATAPNPFNISVLSLFELPEKLRGMQPAFKKTGGLHASALFDEQGVLLCVREDVGRHNALDKLIGWALMSDKIPLANSGLLVSGRVSYEIIQKSISASIAMIAAVGAPTSLAVSLAEKFRLPLIGFLKSGSMTSYSRLFPSTHPRQIETPGNSSSA